MAQQMLRTARRGLEKCKAFFDKHYVLANVAVYGGMYSFGDITCQLISHANTTTPVDWERTKRMGMVGCTLLPVMNTYFYRVLDRTLVGTSPSIVLTKMVIDTFVWSPICFSTFVGALTALEGRSWSEIKHEIQRKFLPIFKSGLLVWPLAQTINFAFVHPRFRMVYISFVGFCWVNILSYIKHKHMDEPMVHKIE